MQDLDNIQLANLEFKSKETASLDEIADYIDYLKNDLFDDKWSIAVKQHIKSSLVLYIRTTQKKLAPTGAHYRAVDIQKQHLEHVIPQNKIVNAYLHDKLTAKEVLQMPLCMIDDGDKHTLEQEWQTGATWKLPFKRYALAGYNKSIKNVKGELIDFNTWTMEDHFKMLGFTPG